MTKTASAPTLCLRCGRTLTKSVGYGPTCARKIREAAKVVNLTEFRDAKSALAKAVELIEQGGIVRTRVQGVYLAVSSDGGQQYMVDTVEGSCNCRGCQRTGHCYHVVAGNILQTSSRKTA